ncbi:MAG: hypothetical protein Q9179_003044 [Wetmoreana sp. 5 TL-2023]
MAPKDADSLDTIGTNTSGLLLTQHLLSTLLQAKEPKVALMSSRVESIADNASGGAYSYRTSRAPLNSIGKSMTTYLNNKGVVILLLHPGLVINGLDKIGEMEKNPAAVMSEEAAWKLWGILK